MQIRYYLILILLVFSLVLNLGIYPLYLEEPRRAVVSLEMLISGNYIVPTIMGELYFAKPPLFNWIIILFSKILGGISELTVRLPTVVSLLLIGIFHYLVSFRYIGKNVAFYSSIAFITSGTILFYFSLLGEIDIFYSLITYLCIISIFWFFYHNHKLLFVFPFIFASAGFLTKGFPSVLFLYITLITVFFFEKRLRLIFSIWHVIGVLIFIATLGSYLYLYNQFFPVEKYILYLWKESSQRTVVENAFSQFVYHFFEFPLKTLVAVLPWSFLIIFLFEKGTFSAIIKNKFLRFSLIVFAFNYAVYWFSPGANQRYVYMLFPFLLTIFVYMYFKGFISLFKVRLIKFIYSSVLLIFALVSISLLFVKYFKSLSFLSYISIFFGIIFLILSFRVWKKPVYYMVIGLIWFRVLFDMVYLPIKAISGTSFLEKKYGIQVADLTKGHNLFYYGKDRVSYGLLFYIENNRKSILKKFLKIKEDNYYLSKKKFLKENLNIEKVLEFKIKDNYVLFKKIGNTSSYNTIKSTIP